ncbi:MAG: cation diffusion facilitator family transporter [Planctomycetota bacterium]|jgi:cation diffusion facilitator family transporter
MELKPPTEERDALLRRALRLEWTLIAYNLLEAVAALTFGILAASIALIGFGFDSVIEFSAAIILIWRLRMERKGRPYEKAEKTAQRFIGVTFFALAAYVIYESVSKLVTQSAPEESVPGIVLASMSLIVMPILGFAKLRIARKIESGALRADAMETLVCAYLSFALLLGLLLNVLAGWWWADPVAALCMVPLMLREGWEALRGEGCACKSFPTS